MLAPSGGTAAALFAVRQTLKQSLFAVGYYHRRLSNTVFPGIAVLCYHGIRTTGAPTPFSDLHVTKATFERHCQLIDETCKPMSLAQFREAREGRLTLAPRSVLVTFDDGYRGVLDDALPVLERYRIPAAVFVAAEPVLDRQHFWFDTLWRRQGEAAVLKARTLAYDDWRTLIKSIETAADETDWHRPLTSAELTGLAASPLIEIGAHTMSHPTLALAGREAQRHEITRCKTALERMTGKPVTAFAYPYGNAGEDYTEETVSIVRDAGFDLAFTTSESFATLRCDALQIPRFTMLDTVGEAELAHRLAHSWRASTP